MSDFLNERIDKSTEFVICDNCKHINLIERDPVTKRIKEEKKDRHLNLDDNINYLLSIEKLKYGSVNKALTIIFYQLNTYRRLYGKLSDGIKVISSEPIHLIKENIENG